MDYPDNLKIAVMIPCWNEEQTLGSVIEAFRQELPTARIIVFDNNSSDRSVEIAQEHKAEIFHEPRQGKGFVIETMFNTIDADVFVMADGDDTYPAENVHQLIEPVLKQRCDMAVGARLANHTDNSFRDLHVFGNRLVRFCINKIMGADLKDIMSGYRVFNRQIVGTLPVISSGFEIETEMTIQTLYYQRKIIEIDVPYRARPEGSESKLNTFRDGFRVLWKIFSLYRSLKPLTCFGGIGGGLLVISLLVGFLPVRDYFVNPDHYVEHVPSAILAAGLMMLSFLFSFTGLLLHVINHRFRELHNVIIRMRK
ncbi:MAG: glycosyl transferase [Planctomycetota bacterium]|nr:MAG: glycosyl transferase [Planctomycetota bacterium]